MLRTPDIVTAKLAESEPLALGRAATQSKKTDQIDPAQIRALFQNGDNNQAIKAGY